MSVVPALITGGASLLGSLFGGSSAKKAARAATAAQERSTAAMIAQADRAAKMQYDLGQEQLALARRQYEEYIPIRDKVVGLQTAAQEQQMAQAKDYYDYLQQVFRPQETRMAAQVAQMDTEAYRERMAQEAVQRAAMAFQGGQDMASRELLRRGLNPNSGAFASMTNQNAIQSAALQATGANAARTNAEQLAWARGLDVAGLGRNLPGASSGAYGGATGAGSAAVSNMVVPGQAYNQTAGLGFDVISSGFGQGISGYNAAATGLTTMARDANANYYGMLGVPIGAGFETAGYMLGNAYTPPKATTSKLGMTWGGK